MRSAIFLVVLSSGRRRAQTSSVFSWSLNESELLTWLFEIFEAFTNRFKPNLAWQRVALTSRSQNENKVSHLFWNIQVFFARNIHSRQKFPWNQNRWNYKTWRKSPKTFAFGQIYKSFRGHLWLQLSIYGDFLLQFHEKIR